MARLCGGSSLLPLSTCFTGSSPVPVDHRGNVLKCHILLRAQSQSSLQLKLIMSRHLLGRKRAQRGREREGGREEAGGVCSCATPCALIVKMSDLSLPSLLSLPPLPLHPPCTLFINGSIQLFTSHLRATTGQSAVHRVEMIQHTTALV